MTPSSGSALARPYAPIMSVILDGCAWKARLIRNNNLRQHCHLLARCFKNKQFHPLKEVCTPLFVLLETKSRVFHDIHPNQLALVEAIIRIGAYRNSWLRSPESWQPNQEQNAHDQWADFLRHLMALYPVPRFLDSAWLAHGTLEYFERDCWCTLARGQSLRSLRDFPSSISKRVLHLALTSTEKITLPTAIWKTQMELQKVSPALFMAVMSSRAPNELCKHDLWSRLLSKFIAGQDEQAADFDLVADALDHIGTTGGSPQIENLMRLPLTELIQHSRKHFTGLLASFGYTVQASKSPGPKALSKLHMTGWTPMLGNSPIYPQHNNLHAPSPWRMEELCNHQALVAEGKNMNHCVAGYAGRCRHGTSAIFSLRRRNLQSHDDSDVFSHVTIEVSPFRRKIVQIRAYKNRPVNSLCMNMIQAWAKANRLML